MLRMIMNMEGFVNEGLREGDLSLRGDNEVGDVAIYRVSKKRTGVRFVYCGAVDRHGLSALTMTSWRGSRDEKPGTIEWRAN
jgi:hypothetical protein